MCVTTTLFCPTNDATKHKQLFADPVRVGHKVTAWTPGSLTLRRSEYGSRRVACCGSCRVHLLLEAKPRKVGLKGLHSN